DAKNEKGLHRVSWDLRYPAPNPIRLTKPAFQPPWASDPVGPLVPPGTYSVELFVTENGRLTGRGSVHSFEVKPIPTLEKLDFKAIAAFQSETRNLMLQITSFGASLGEANDRLRYIEAGLRKATTSEAEHFSTVDLLKRRIGELQFSLYGDPARNSLDESTLPGIQGRVGAVAWNHWNTTQLPSETLKQNLAQGKNDFDAFKADAVQFFRDMEAFESELKEIGVPYTKGRGF
ncbi:MAG: glycosyl hydrolase, partial [Ekhidna sp.]|nr:glycosyl hydrolase [Ekhidna sp.]